jgi:hypothetical protein
MKKNNLEVIGTAMLPEQKILTKVSAKEVAEVLKKEATEKIIKNRVLGIVSNAMAAVEREDMRVADVVLGPDTYNVLRKYLPLDPYTSTKELKTGLFADLWGARVWVDKEVVGLMCFSEDSKELGKQFPSIVIAKKLLKIEDI